MGCFLPKGCPPPVQTRAKPWHYKISAALLRFQSSGFVERALWATARGPAGCR